MTWGQPPPRPRQATFQSGAGGLPRPQGRPGRLPEGRLSQPPRFAGPERAGLGKGWTLQPSRSATSRLPLRPFQVPPLGYLYGPSRFPPAFKVSKPTSKGLPLKGYPTQPSRSTTSIPCREASSRGMRTHPLRPSPSPNLQVTFPNLPGSWSCSLSRAFAEMRTFLHGLSRDLPTYRPRPPALTNLQVSFPSVAGSSARCPLRTVLEFRLPIEGYRELRPASSARECTPPPGQ